VQRVPVPPPVYFLVFRPAYIATGSGFFNPFTGTRFPPPFFREFDLKNLTAKLLNDKYI
jgi:hypothetical protein